MICKSRFLFSNCSKIVNESRHLLATRTSNVNRTKRQLDEFVASLSEHDKLIILDSIRQLNVPVPENPVSLVNSIPFIGFGFLDNLLMILAGDYIDAKLGTSLCISTMAAAALGNTFSDICGIGSAYYVERAAGLLGLRMPTTLTNAQLNLPKSRLASNFGKVIGITIGCLLGMFPLLFHDNDPRPISANKN